MGHFELLLDEELAGFEPNNKKHLERAQNNQPKWK